MNYPENLRYTKEHEWLSVEGNIATIGITDFAQDQLGDIVFVDFEVEEGDDIQQGDTFGSVEAVKTVSDLYVPISGTVKELNEQLEDSPESINQSPYGEGWILKVEIADSAQIDALLTSSAYADMVAE